MAFIKNTQGVGSKGDGVYHNGTAQNVCVFDGVTRFNIGTGAVGDYDPPANNVARTYLTLHKKTSGVQGYVYSTTKDTTTGEYINDSSINNIFLRMGQGGGGSNSLTVGSNIKSNIGKWHTSSIDYDGSLFITNSIPVVNGIKSQNIFANFQLTNNINSEHLGYLGWHKQSNSFFTGNMAIFSIYEGVFTSNQKSEYASDPFGFLTRLRADFPANFYLDIDFNKTGFNLPVDLSPNAFPISLGAGTVSYTTFS